MDDDKRAQLAEILASKREEIAKGAELSKEVLGKMNRPPIGSGIQAEVIKHINDNAARINADMITHNAILANALKPIGPIELIEPLKETPMDNRQQILNAGMGTDASGAAINTPTVPPMHQLSIEIAAMHEILDRLRSLTCAVAGADYNPDPIAQWSDPPLRVVLLDGPVRLSEARRLMHDEINTLENLLFES